jgi:hypothetical protein
METAPPDQAWERALREAAARDSVEQEKRFLELVDRASGHISRDVARALVGTFSAKPDHGTQERVCSVLASGEPSIVLDAILEQLPRLVEDAPEWAEILFGGEVHWRPAETCEAMRRAATEARRAAIQLLKRKDFAQFYPNSAEVLASASA